MLLAIDIGNTHTVVGVFQGERLLAEWRLSSSDRRTSDELWLVLKQLLQDAGISQADCTAAGIASVVPDLTGVFESIARTRLRCAPVVVSGALDLGVRIHYADPAAVGADRLCNAVAGFRKFGGPLV